MPVFFAAHSDLARDLTRAAAGAFAIVADTRQDSASEAEVRISFDSPVGASYLDALLDKLHAAGADGLRGTFFGKTTTITAGYTAGDSDLRGQLRSFYNQQLDGTSTILAGLRQDLAVDSTESQRRATRAEIANVERFRSALADREPLISAVVVEAVERGTLEAMTAAGSPVQSVEVVSSRQEPDAAGAPSPVRTIAHEADGVASARASVARAQRPTAHAASASPRSFMPNRWNLRTMAERETDSPYVKNSYLGFKFTQSGTLDWYQHDDHHDRGFEAQARPFKGGGLWSTNWYQTHIFGDNIRRGPCPDPRPGCSAVWNSNMPDAYRDDLTSDGRFPEGGDPDYRASPSDRQARSRSTTTCRTSPGT